MRGQIGLGIVLGLILVGQQDLQAEEAGKELRPHLTLVACDRVGIAAETWLTAKAQTARILNNAGIGLTWIDARTSSCHVPPLTSYVMVVVVPRAPKGWTSPDAMGMAALPADIRCSVPVRRPCPRAYVFYDIVRALIRYRKPPIPDRMSLGIVLGHTIAHELGHLLIPSEAHGGGIMRPHWVYQEWQLIFQGGLLFNPDHAKLIQTQLTLN